MPRYPKPTKEQLASKETVSSMTGLVRYEAAKQALVEAKSVDEAKEIRDKAEAMRCYAQQAKDRQLETDAAEIRMRAERRLGEMLAAQKAAGNMATGAAGIGKPASAVPSEYSTQAPTLSEVGIDRKLSSRAQKLAAVPEAEFEGMIGEWRERIEVENERVTTNLLRAGERERRDAELSENVMPLPEGVYEVIYADPPWRYEHPPMGGNRVIENHYPTMSLEEICALDVESIAANDSVLFLWATAPKLSECMEVITAWGFNYRTCAVWVKDKIGMGYYVRNQHELLLIAKRGEFPVPEPSNRPSSLVQAPRTEHSAKPDEFYDMIERMYPGALKVELFKRGKRDGWAVWGNQAEAAE